MDIFDKALKVVQSCTSVEQALNTTTYLNLAIRSKKITHSQYMFLLGVLYGLRFKGNSNEVQSTTNYSHTGISRIH